MIETQVLITVFQMRGASFLSGGGGGGRAWVRPIGGIGFDVGGGDSKKL